MDKWIHLYIDKRLHVGNQPLLVSLNNSLIRMYASCGLIDKAYRVFIGMQQRNIVTWNTMITVGEIGQVPSEPKCLVDYLALLIQRFGRRAGDMKVFPSKSSLPPSYVFSPGNLHLSKSVRTSGIA
ncbi:hypothetical protein CK203_030945 [Vitis vinifera]|uniref:Pentatricopeptide repeat-containing protein n=1 Tax=Vitis vinifera TaxID=29760 RepID=A0A438I170_VITVI|nr:hypothetical protein CK203_030945 [Vitis vinifera]